ncbi:MAG TPA: hypothetical protein VFO55_01180 [Gemmatimonadaceae bacterium]|nr:hypothetical protein [Gemmatimonadaceae bacterium]
MSGSTGGSTGMGASAGTSDGGNAGGMSGTEQSAGLADRARGALGSAGEKLGDVGSTVRERAAGAKDSLANALESGAEKLRARAGDGTMAGAGAMGGSVAVTDDRMTQVTTKVAGGMEAASEWLRDADLENLKGSIEQQVKEHPGRTLLIAVGLGYLLGKALRK